MTNISENTAELQVNEELKPFQIRRQELKALSKALKPLVEVGAFETVNQAIVDSYTNSENSIFKTFHQWKKDGKKIIKGSKAFCVWGKPREKEQEDETETDEFRFWPVAYLFSNAQVI